MTKYRCKLINKILVARSGEEVRRFIEAALKGLKEHKVNGHLIVRFMEKANQDLFNFDRATQDAQAATNIEMARKLFNQLKQAIPGNEKEIL